MTVLPIITFYYYIPGIHRYKLVKFCGRIIHWTWWKTISIFLIKFKTKNLQNNNLSTQKCHDNGYIIKFEWTESIKRWKNSEICYFFLFSLSLNISKIFLSKHLRSWEKELWHYMRSILSYCLESYQIFLIFRKLVL